MEADEIILHTESQMQKSVEHTLHEFSTVHTGKASPTMVESVKVEAYGSQMTIKEVAAVTTPDPRTIQIEPWDKGLAQAIEKAVRAANLGFNPVARGNTIFCPLPELSGERRKELVKVTSGIAEQGKVSVRAARREAMDSLKQKEKEKEVSEDDLKRAEKEVQNLTDRFVKEIEEHLKHKEEELTQV